MTKDEARQMIKEDPEYRELLRRRVSEARRRAWLRDKACLKSHLGRDVFGTGSGYGSSQPVACYPGGVVFTRVGSFGRSLVR